MPLLIVLSPAHSISIMDISTLSLLAFATIGIITASTGFSMTCSPTPGERHYYPPPEPGVHCVTPSMSAARFVPLFIIFRPAHSISIAAFATLSLLTPASLVIITVRTGSFSSGGWCSSTGRGHYYKAETGVHRLRPKGFPNALRIPRAS